MSLLHFPLSDYNSSQMSFKSSGTFENMSARGFSYKNIHHFQVEYDLVFSEFLAHVSACHDLSHPVIVVASKFCINIVSPSEFLTHHFPNTF